MRTMLGEEEAEILLFRPASVDVLGLGCRLLGTETLLGTAEALPLLPEAVLARAGGAEEELGAFARSLVTGRGVSTAFVDPCAADVSVNILPPASWCCSA